MGALVFALVVFWLGSAILCTWHAGEKNRDQPSWFTLGLFLGLAALIAIAGAPSVDKRSGPSRICPLCDERISARATRCPQCTGLIDPPRSPDVANGPHPRRSVTTMEFCTNCAEKLFPGDRVCPKCKTARTATS